jgi:hypothetical protein
MPVPGRESSGFSVSPSGFQEVSAARHDCGFPSGREGFVVVVKIVLK